MQVMFSSNHKHIVNSNNATIEKTVEYILYYNMSNKNTNRTIAVLNTKRMIFKQINIKNKMLKLIDDESRHLAEDHLLPRMQTTKK